MLRRSRVQQHLGIETMNVVPQTTSATDPIASEGVVAAGVYVDGRRVANIAIDEASSWRSKPGHVVWIGLYEPDLGFRLN
jgi:magnesium transporter